MSILNRKKAAGYTNTANTAKEPVAKESVTESQLDLDRLTSILRNADEPNLDAGNINLNFGVIDNIINRYDKGEEHPNEDLLKKMLDASDKMLAKLSNNDFVGGGNEYLSKSNIVQRAKNIKARIEKYLG